MIVGRAPVKHSHGGAANRPKGGQTVFGWLRARTLQPHAGWLDGWALILPSAGLALVAAIVAVPRATEPRWVPEPVSRPHELAADLEHAARLARQVQSSPLPFAVREVGELYRRVGRTQYESAQAFAGAQVQSWQDMLRTVEARVGARPILQLRALQCALLVAAIQHWQSTGAIDDDLIELGGDLLPMITSARASLTEAEGWALALKRWTSLAGLARQAEFQPPREIELTQLHFFYEHPPEADDSLDVRARILNRYAQLDPTFPANYALGVLMAKSGRLGPAASLFAKQLELHPDGPFALRARNHLIWAAKQLNVAVDDGNH